MSCLKLYWPQTFSLYAPQDDAAEECSVYDDGDAVVLLFPRSARRRQQGQQELLARARLIRENRTCPICNRAAVVPVNADQGVPAGNHMPVPGAGTIVGFECDCCGHTWEA